MLKHILPLFPPHKIFVDVFGGSGVILLNKRKSPLEVFNDLNGNIVNFYRVLRDKEKLERLIHALELTPYARDEKRFCWENRDADCDEIERSRRWYVIIRQGFSGAENNCWGFTKNPHVHCPRTFTFYNSLPNFRKIHERIKNWQIENRDFEFILKTYIIDDTLLYLDPPYQIKSRRKKTDIYQLEMTDRDHERLLELCAGHNQMIVISHYESELYAKYLFGWKKFTFENYVYSDNRTKNLNKCFEVVWLNPKAWRALQESRWPLFQEIGE